MIAPMQIAYVSFAANLWRIDTIVACADIATPHR